jgi:beta-galactosidase
MQRSLGTCYYPEHWDEALWHQDARQMVEAGLTWVRIGEFAWKRMEPYEGKFEFDWLDKSIDILGQAGLKVVLGTPTATPPKWVVDKYPDMLARDENGNLRKFGSRRHYCFSHIGYLEQCRDIVTRLAKRYGGSPHVAAWQTDNEYGCHNTSISYSDAACDGFSTWLRDVFPGKDNDGDIIALNRAWGNVFWSMEYDSFEDIDLPNLTVTEANPAHILAFRRYSSEKIVEFNRAQVDIIRQYSDAPIAHNYMGRITDFDHFKVGKDLDIASWDSYPLGFLEDRIGASEQEQIDFSRQGHPDFQAFHHDLYRAVGKGRWWVMEQQPGPVNWAPYNPAPLPGMVRLWTWEAFAHGAETVCYFRWRQAPFAQEQMHAGLLRPDNAPAPAMVEIQQVTSELREAIDIKKAKARIAIMFDYDSDNMWSIQPQGQSLSYFDLNFEVYCALRRLGLSIDFLSSDTRDFAKYELIVASGLMHMPDDLKESLAQCGAQVLLGPRSAARDEHMAIPVPLPPNLKDFDVTVAQVQTQRPEILIQLAGGGAVKGYLEHIEGDAEDVLKTSEGDSVAKAAHNMTYLAGWLDDLGFERLLTLLCEKAKIEIIKMPYGVRRRRAGDEEFWFNYTAYAVDTTVGSIAPADLVRL